MAGTTIVRHCRIHIFAWYVAAAPRGFDTTLREASEEDRHNERLTALPTTKPEWKGNNDE
jgi:hypothetical protein